MLQSLGQIQVITFSWFISILKEFYMWGESKAIRRAILTANHDSAN